MWKDITGWEGLYEVHPCGDVRNKLTKHKLSGDTNSAGYQRVCLYRKGHLPPKQRFFRHRLVAQEFIPNPQGLPEVNHINHILSDNSADNLEWCTREYNELDSRLNGAKEYKPFQVCYSDGRAEIFNSKPSLANRLGVTKSLVAHWLKNRGDSYRLYGIDSITYLTPKSLTTIESNKCNSYGE